MIVTCSIMLLYQTGILVDARYAIDVAQDKGVLFQQWHLENKLEELKQKADKICEGKVE